MTDPITQAVILAAGYGSRLRPITEEMPKAMAPIGGRPLLAHTIEHLKSQGVTRFIINLHYLPERITSYFGDGSRFGVNVRYSDEMDRLMDTAGGLKKMESWLDEEFLLLYGDRLHHIDFRPIVTFHRERGSAATLVLRRSDLPQNNEVVEIDKISGRILAYHIQPHYIYEFEKPDMYLNSGLYVLSKKVLDYIPSQVPVHLDKQVIPDLLERGVPVYGYPTTQDILDITTPDKYRAAEEWFQKNG